MVGNIVASVTNLIISLGVLMGEHKSLINILLQAPNHL